MAKKNKKRSKKLIKSVRQKKREYYQKMTPKQKREYEKEKKRNNKLPYGYDDYKLSPKEWLALSLVIIFFLAALFGIGYLIYLGIYFLIHLGG